MKTIGASFLSAIFIMTVIGAVAQEPKTNANDLDVKALPKERSSNLALHRPYEMDPPGNYHYGADTMCTGPEDATDLTDGKHVVCKGGRIWFQKGAVGIWSLPKEIGRVTIDLGASYPVGRVKVYACRMPGAGVQLEAWAPAAAKGNESKNPHLVS